MSTNSITTPAQEIDAVELAPSTEKADFTQISNDILKHPDISATAKLTYGMLLSYAWFQNRVFPGQDRLAGEIQKTARTVRRHIKELQKHQLLTVKRRGQGLTNIYILHVYVAPDRTKMSIEIDEEQINTLIEFSLF